MAWQCPGDSGPSTTHRAAVCGFLNPECITIPAQDATAILEVKWDAFLPDVIRDAVQIPRRRAEDSKYAVCRMYD